MSEFQKDENGFYCLSFFTDMQIQTSAALKSKKMADRIYYAFEGSLKSKSLNIFLSKIESSSIINVLKSENLYYSDNYKRAYCHSEIFKLLLFYCFPKYTFNKINSITKSHQDSVKPKPYFLYFIGFYTFDEAFIKIGVSNNPEQRQLSLTTGGNYNSKILKVLAFKNEGEALIEEHRIITEYKKYTYKPKLHFKGSEKECFTKDILTVYK